MPISNVAISNLIDVDWGNAVADTINIIAVPGAITMYGGSTAPTGYLICDGTAVSRTTYADLFTAIGTNYGTGNGTTTFNLPNLVNRFPTGGTPGASGGSADSIVVSHNHSGSSASVGHNHNVSVSGSTAGMGYELVFRQASAVAGWWTGRNDDPANGVYGTMLDGTNLNVASYGIYAGMAVGYIGDHGHAFSGTGATTTDGAHSHSVTVNSNGSSGTGANLPPYTGVRFIIKT